MKKLLLLTFIVCLWAFPALADTHVAASLSQADFNTAVAAATAGDIVSLPAGSATWSAQSTVAIAITVQGAGAGLTTIINGYHSATWPNCMLNWTAAVRITGITFSMDSTTVSNDTNWINYTGTGFRIDHCSFIGGGTHRYPIAVYNAYGIIDHNLFSNAGPATASQVAVYGRSDSWSTASTLGTANAVYFEDNIFTDTRNPISGRHCVMADRGARVVFRYNTVDDMDFDSHGNVAYTAAQGGGTRHVEVYSNIWSVDAGQAQTRWFNVRGGTGVFYSNTMTETGNLINHGATLMEYRLDMLPENGEGCCCTYPCTDQVGRGNAQALEPLYFWSNTVNGVAATCVVQDYADPGVCEGTCSGTQDAANFIVVNQDFYLSAMPGYVAYTYPHQLIPRTVTISVNGGNGSGAVDGVAGSGLVVYGATAAITFTPASGFHTESVSPSGCTTDWVSGNSCTTSAITTDATVTVAFAPDAGTGALIGIGLGGAGTITGIGAGGGTPEGAGTITLP
jgi:hypothetical protein